MFEGKASESVTCNTLEWIYSYGGGSVIEPDKKGTINNPNAIKALDTAHSWSATFLLWGYLYYSLHMRLGRMPPAMRFLLSDRQR